MNAVHSVVEVLEPTSVSLDATRTCAGVLLALSQEFCA